MIDKLNQAVIENRSEFAVMMGALRRFARGRISSALYQVGGQYRRSLWIPGAYNQVRHTYRRNST